MKEECWEHSFFLHLTQAHPVKIDFFRSIISKASLFNYQNFKMSSNCVSESQITCSLCVKGVASVRGHNPMTNGLSLCFECNFMAEREYEERVSSARHQHISLYDFLEELPHFSNKWYILFSESDDESRKVHEINKVSSTILHRIRQGHEKPSEHIKCFLDDDDMKYCWDLESVEEDDFDEMESEATKQESIPKPSSFAPGLIYEVGRREDGNYARAVVQKDGTLLQTDASHYHKSFNNLSFDSWETWQEHCVENGYGKYPF